MQRRHSPLTVSHLPMAFGSVLPLQSQRWHGMPSAGLPKDSSAQISHLWEEEISRVGQIRIGQKCHTTLKMLTICPRFRGGSRGGTRSCVKMEVKNNKIKREIDQFSKEMSLNLKNFLRRLYRGRLYSENFPIGVFKSWTWVLPPPAPIRIPAGSAPAKMPPH